MKNLLNFLLGILLLMTVVGCDTEEEAIPAYLQIDNYTITTSASQGSDSHNIQDVWVYANNNLIGGFNLPATIPILESGAVDIVIDPGIRDNGVSSSPRIYPYYTRFETTVNLVEGEVVSLTPSSTYNSNVTFALVEDFEESNLFEDDRDNNSATQINLSIQGAYEGSSGRIELTTDNPRIEVASNLVFEDLPTDASSQVYLEMDYKNDIALAIGLIGVDEFGFEFAFYSHVVTPQGDWNKVYINLTEVLFNSDLETYQIGFATTLPSELNSATIMLDNIKLVY